MNIWNGKRVGHDGVCCVCGAANRRMNLHHVVPGCYRKPLHHDRNYHDFYDIVTTCVPCHDTYEKKYALYLKCELSDRYGVPRGGSGLVYPHGSSAIRAAGALLRHCDKIPDNRVAELWAEIVSHLGREPKKSDIVELARKRWNIMPGPEYVSNGELVVALVEDMQAFWRMWREHFVQKMKPKFLPSHWDTNREVRWSPERCRRRKGPNCPCSA